MYKYWAILELAFLIQLKVLYNLCTNFSLIIFWAVDQNLNFSENTLFFSFELNIRLHNKQWKHSNFHHTNFCGNYQNRKHNIIIYLFWVTLLKGAISVIHLIPFKMCGSYIAFWMFTNYQHSVDVKCQFVNLWHFNVKFVHWNIQIEFT